MRPSATLLAEFGATTPVFVTETQIATVWKVTHNNSFAALKIYKNGNTQDEWQGFDLLEALDGNGSALIFGRKRNAALMEWLNGASLGDLSRSGNDDQATVEIGRIANKVHSSNVCLELRSVEDNFDALLSLKISGTWPHELRSQMAAAQNLAAYLIDNQIDVCALHGDLHHDNIKLGARGYVAFDAKGLIGDRAYDVANAFKNPVDAPEIYGNPSRITRLVDALSASMDIPAKRLLGWAAAHCALSIVWTGQIDGDPHLAQLQKLMTAYQAAR